MAVLWDSCEPIRGVPGTKPSAERVYFVGVQTPSPSAPQGEGRPRLAADAADPLERGLEPPLYRTSPRVLALRPPLVCVAACWSPTVPTHWSSTRGPQVPTGFLGRGGCPVRPGFCSFLAPTLQLSDFDPFRSSRGTHRLTTETPQHTKKHIYFC